MMQNASYLCIAKRVTGHGVNSNYSHFMIASIASLFYNRYDNYSHPYDVGVKSI